MKDHNGRFGNCLYLYALSIYLSKKYNKPFVYRSFKYSDKLLLHAEADTKFATYERIELIREVRIFSELKKKHKNILFLCGFKTDFVMHQNYLAGCHFFERNIAMIAQNLEILNLLRARIQLINPIPKINDQGLPSIALHIRTGGGFQIDQKEILKLRQSLKDITYQETNMAYLLKFIQFVGYEFYFKAIKSILNELNDSRCYIHIFTDDDHPEKILNIFKEKFKNEPIIFDCRKFNGHDFNVVEDFFMMIQFDYLIRTSSTYTQMIQLLGNHKKVIYPAKSVIQNGNINVKKVHIVESGVPPKIIEIDFKQLPSN